MKLYCIIEIFEREFVVEAKCFDYYEMEGEIWVETPAGDFRVKRFV